MEGFVPSKNGKRRNEMEWYQVGTIVAANLGLFLWTVRQSRADYLQCQKSIESFKDAMMKETKDFHGRLCSIESRIKEKK
jgi:hypothetical protein